MTKTLTTEAMQEIYESAVHSEATGDDQDAQFELLCKLEDVGGTSATIRKLIDMVRAANREEVPVSGECNKEVYENGQSACLVDIPKETAEVICRGISEATGCKVDWHYIGGRVHIKATAPPALAVVKLPTTRLWAGVVECYSKDDVISAMNTAGVEISND